MKIFPYGLIIHERWQMFFFRMNQIQFSTPDSIVLDDVLGDPWRRHSDANTMGRLLASYAYGRNADRARSFETNQCRSIKSP